MTFVVQPGPIRNVLPNGELRVRDRYSAINTFTEPAIAQKAYPLVWNVGRHVRNASGKIQLSNPERFSIISSFENQKVGFANEEVDKKLRIDFSNNETEYEEIYNLYANGGINSEDSPLTYWEFLQYRETVFPHMKNQFQKENLIRENFKSFYRHSRADRAETFLTNSFGYHGAPNHDVVLTHSSWPLDAPDDFLTRNLKTDTAESIITGNRSTSSLLADIDVVVGNGGSGILQQNYGSFLRRSQFVDPVKDEVLSLVNVLVYANPDSFLSPLPTYARPVTLINTQSVSNPCGMQIPETASANYGSTHRAFTVFQIVSASSTGSTSGTGSEGGLPAVHHHWHGRDSKFTIEEPDGSTVDFTFTPRLDHGSNGFTRLGARNYRINVKGYRVSDLTRELRNAMVDSMNTDGLPFRGTSANIPSAVNNFNKDTATGYVFGAYSLTASAGQTLKFFPNAASTDRTDTNRVASSSFVAGVSGSGCYTFTGQALWEAGAKREIKDSDGNYILSTKNPFYDSYLDYSEEIRKRAKNFSLVPEFRLSPLISQYLDSSKAPTNIFELTGGTLNSSDQDSFYKIYSNSDFMRQFEVISSDHEEFTNAKVLSLRCKAIKKFLPYEGFYPAQRSVQLAEKFYEVYRPSISSEFDSVLAAFSDVGSDNFGLTPITKVLFSPGILFNTIKSGLAVDYPIAGDNERANIPRPNDNEFMVFDEFSERIPFEALVEPQKHLVGIKIRNPEPHPSGTFQFSTVLNPTSDVKYVQMANNFLAESIEFFLPNGELTSISSKKQGEGINLTSGSVYGMRIKMNRSMTGKRLSVVTGAHEDRRYFVPQDIPNSDYRETFTMYSRPSAFGMPTYGRTKFNNTPFLAEDDRVDFVATNTIVKDSRQGYNFPFTPPYYHGEAWCDITLTASKNTYTIREIQEQATYTYSRFDHAHYEKLGGAIESVNSFGPQSFPSLNDQAVQLSSSLNLRGISRNKRDLDNQIVESTLDSLNRWTIQTKFETPMFNFNHLSSSDISLPLFGSESVARGIWHQYGRIPEEEEGVFMSVSKIPSEFQRFRLGKTEDIIDLSKVLGFSGVQAKLGRIRAQKTISEAVVAVPFIEENGTKRFFTLDKDTVNLYKEGGTLRATLTSGEPDGQIGRSVLDQLEKMNKYVFPPSFDFLNNSTEEVEPIAMYIFEFSHTLTQQDLADIWQNLPPDIGTEMEESEIAITHPILKKELLGPGGEKGNTVIDMPNKLKWMVFKVKQRAASNYFEKTVSRNPERERTSNDDSLRIDEFGTTSNIQYNWPYDFFSLVELVKVDAEVELGNADFSNYTAHLPPWDAVVASDNEIVEMLASPEVNDINLNDYLGYPDWENRPDAPGDDQAPESAAGNQFLQERFDTLDSSIEGVQAAIAAKMGQEQAPENVQPGGVAAMFGEVDEAAGGAGGITGVLGGPLEQMGEGDGNDSAQDGDNFDQNNQSGLGGAPNPGANV